MSDPLRLVVDGGDRHAALPGRSPWVEVAPWLVTAGGVAVFWLDRGDASMPVPAGGVERLPFPSHARGACAADSLLLQRLCDHCRADAFAAVGWTSPVWTPSLGLVDDRASQPLPAGAPRQAREERALATALAARLLCSSATVRARLLADNAGLPAARVAVAAIDWQSDAPARWARVLGRELRALVLQCRAEAAGGDWAGWAREWRRLRALQAMVDV